MEINKYNLFINESFDKYKFDSNTNNGVFSVVNTNMISETIYLVINTKPSNNTDSVTININDVSEIYLFPASNTNVSFGVGELLQTVDNNALFIITNHVSGNKFGLRLVTCTNGATYTLYNNTSSLIYNEKSEYNLFSLNSNKTKVIDQQTNYTEVLSNTSQLNTLLSSKVTFFTDYTSDYTVAFDFSDLVEFAKIANIIDKFYINFLVYDYNNFKYIYRRDLISEINDNNYKLTDSNYIIGVLKTANTKILPHMVFRLQKGKTYEFTDTKIGKYTSYEQNYTGGKILLVIQLTLNDKSSVYDLNNNIESDSIYVII